MSRWSGRWAAGGVEGPTPSTPKPHHFQKEFLVGTKNLQKASHTENSKNFENGIEREGQLGREGAANRDSGEITAAVTCAHVNQ